MSAYPVFEKNVNWPTTFTPMRNRASGEIMISNSFDGITRPSLPTLSDVQCRIAELASIQQQLETQPQLHIRSAPRTPPPPSAPPNPILSEAALYGVAGVAVRAVATTAEAQSVGGEETAEESTTEDARNEGSMQEQTKFA
jgi:hypothetical protein